MFIRYLTLHNDWGDRRGKLEGDVLKGCLMKILCVCLALSVGCVSHFSVHLIGLFNIISTD